MFAEAAYFSVPEPMCWLSSEHHRPSLIMESTTFLSPMRMPARASGRMYGAFVMDSMPPATTMSAWPDWMSMSASMIVLMPDRQTLLIRVDGTLIGMPAATEA